MTRRAPDVNKLSALQRARLAKRAVSRLVDPDTNEQLLWLSVILAAVDDLALPDTPDRDSAVLYFLRPDYFSEQCDYVGLDREAVLEILAQAKLLEISPPCMRATA